MGVRNCIVFFCLLTFAVGTLFMTSCIKEKSRQEESGNAEESVTGESTTKEPAMEESVTEESEGAPPRSPEAAESQDGVKAPMFQGKNLVDGTNMALADLKGHVLIIDFWATWCGPCRMEIPWFVEFSDKYKDKKFAVVGISVDRAGEGVVKKFIDKYKINYPVIMVTPQIQRDYEKAMGKPIRGIPTTLIVNQAGKIATVHVGVPRSRDPKAVFEKEILELLGQSS